MALLVALHASDDVIFKVFVAVVLQIRALLNVMPHRWPDRYVPTLWRKLLVR